MKEQETLTKQKDINLMVEEFKQRLVDTINQSELPAAMVYYIFKDTFTNVEQSYFNYLNEASKQLQENVETISVPVQVADVE